MIKLKKKSTHSPIKKYTMFRPRVKSRHPSHDILRNSLPLLPFKSIVRLGSTTDMKDTYTNNGKRVEFNTIESIRNSANKLYMKECFEDSGVKTADWFYASTYNIDSIEYPMVVKHIFGSRGTGNTLIKSREELEVWINSHKNTLNRYIFEKFYNYSREYRLHVTKDGCFYTCRKMLKEDTPEENRWYRNDSNCVWILEENSKFDKPSNWLDIVNNSILALNSVGLDAGAVDVKVQSRTKKNGKIREYPEFIIIEINSAPSFGEITGQKYIEIITKILKEKNEL